MHILIRFNYSFLIEVNVKGQNDIGQDLPYEWNMKSHLYVPNYDKLITSLGIKWKENFVHDKNRKKIWEMIATQPLTFTFHQITFYKHKLLKLLG